MLVKSMPSLPYKDPWLEYVASHKSVPKTETGMIN